jgi:uncharacterized lipoprotein YddW (UPF0748 family)
MLLDHPDWVMVGSTGTRFTCENSQAYEYAYVSPRHPAVRTHLARVAADIARRYGVDGIHLDRVRYPSPFLSYDAPSVAAFGRAAPAADPAWQQWRRDAVSAAVREVHDSVAAARPGAVLSAATWGIYDNLALGWPSASSGSTQYFQDPRAWGRGGYLDVNVPMTYYRTQATRCAFTDWLCLLEDHLAGFDAATGRHTYVAITAAANVTTDAEVLHQIALGRERGVKGFAVYSYNAANARNLFALLGGGPVREARRACRPCPWKGAVRLARAGRVAGAGAAANAGASTSRRRPPGGDGPARRDPARRPPTGARAAGRPPPRRPTSR